MPPKVNQRGLIEARGHFADLILGKGDQFRWCHSSRATCQLLVGGCEVVGIEQRSKGSVGDVLVVVGADENVTTCERAGGKRQDKIV